MHTPHLIEQNAIGLVAAQDVDRFFRDVTQIETNIFIDACRRNKVLVLTPTFVYDFAHPTQGRYHIQMFRDQAQRAADYLDYHIRGRLAKSRDWLTERGMWAGRMILPGFMVDMRSHLPDGEANPDFRRYVCFEPYAAVVLAYFKLFHENNGNLTRTWRQIETSGPCFPESEQFYVPEGFRVSSHLKRRSSFTGGLTPAYDALRDMLVNVACIGHWIHQGVIIRWNNHESIIPVDLFMFAFNRLSPTDFLGEKNPEYIPYRPYLRHDRHKRHAEPPVYAGRIVSDDVPEQPPQRVFSGWNATAKAYSYHLRNESTRSSLWYIKAELVDSAIDTMLLERLSATTLDEAGWQTALAEHQSGDRSDAKRIEQAIRNAERTQENLILSLGLVNDREMIERTEAHYQLLKREIELHKMELAKVRTGDRRWHSLTHARPVLERIIARWTEVPRRERRALFEAFAHAARISCVDQITKRVEVLWRDNTVSTREITRESRGLFWDKDRLNRLRQMVDENVDQKIILEMFPEYTWRQLQQRYAYNFNNNRWTNSYRGRIEYPRFTRWIDTVEYKSQAVRVLNTCITPGRNRRCTSADSLFRPRASGVPAFALPRRHPA